ncbi:MAG: hypothetical protein KY439_11620 [Actinobacteria bacterium]|nr:hypothetical protein [Actinomycetota bacterium]
MSEQDEGWDLDPDEMPDVLHRPAGCGACGKTGYHGRFAVHEVMLITEEIERIIVEHGHSEDIKKFAIAQGMLTLRQAGLSHVRTGLTTIQEVLRVIV